MNRKDFELIARVLKSHAKRAEAWASLPEAPSAEWMRRRIAVDFCDECKKINPSFRNDLFLKAAGVQQEASR